MTLRIDAWAPARTQRSRAWVCSISLFAFLGIQAVPGAMFFQEAQAQSQQVAQAGQKQRQKYQFQAAFMDAARTRQQKEALVSQNKRVKASEPTNCQAGDCAVTTKALDLTKVPSEKELMMAGGFGGVLTPIGSADEKHWEAEFDKELKTLGFAQGLATQMAPTTPAGQVLQHKKERLKKLRDINHSFGAAMQEWNKHNYRKAAQMLREHMEENPESPWSGEAALHLGCDAKYNGRFTESAQIFQEIISSTSDEKGSLSTEIHRKAKLRFADLNISTGKLDEARAQLKDIIKTDNDWRRRTWASYWYRTTALYKKQARTLRACGTKALGFVLVDLGKKEQGKRVAAIQPAREEGFSLAELQNLAGKYRLAMRGFKGRAEELKNLPMPVILHYDYDKRVARQKPLTLAKSFGEKSTSAGKLHGASNGAKTPKALPYRLTSRAGHFLVARKVDDQNRRVALYDPQERRHYSLSYDQLNIEWSGSGLVQEKAVRAIAQHTQSVQGDAKQRLKTHLALLSKKEMKEVVGGCCGVPRAPSDMGPNGPKDPDCGSPTWSISPVNLNMYLSDTPLWYKSPIGPSVNITMNYNSEDSINQNTVFGNKWHFNYASYLVEDTAAGGGQITIFMPNSRQESFTPDGNGGFTNRIGNPMKLRKISSTGYELIDPSGETYLYDVPPGTGSLQAFLLQIRDPWGHALNFTYNSKIQLATITDALGKQTKLSYDEHGHIVKAEDPFGRFASFSYDQWGNMVEVVDLEGNAFQYTYDSDVYITQINTAQGAWNFRWLLPNRDFFDPIVGGPNGDDEMMYLTITDPVNRVVRYEYTGAPGTADRTTFVNPAGKRFTTFISLLGDGRGRPVRTVYPNGEEESSPLDAATGAPSKVTDSTGASIGMTYNAQGQIETITDARGFTTRYLYAPNGIDMVGVIDATGKRTGWATFNNKHQITSFKDANNDTVSFTYTAWGALKTVTYPDNSVVTYVYDEGVGSPSRGQVMAVQKDGVTLSAYSYDSQGRTLTATGSDAKTVAYEYNDMDRVTKTTLPDGSTSEAEIGCCGITTAKVARNGKKTYYDYDALKRLTRVQDAAGNSVEFDYDILGNLRAIKDSKGNITSWAYDDLGRVIAKRFADGSVESYGYDLANRTLSRTDAQGRTTQSVYDASGKLLRLDRPGANNDVSLAYDSLGRVARMRDGLGLTTYNYDYAHRVTQINEEWSQSVLSYAYDNMGRRTALGISGGAGNAAYTTSYAYDTLARMSSVSGTATDGVGNAGTWTFGYVGQTGRLNSISHPNGTNAQFAYDGLNRLTGVQNRFAGGAPLSQYGYGYETGAYALRSVRTFEQSQVSGESAEQVDYDYDDVGQLLRETSNQLPTPSLHATYAYDAMGNRSASVRGTGTSAVSSSHKANTLNQHTSSAHTPADGGPSSATLFTHDAHGNLSGVRSTTGQSVNGATRYLYDDADRLTSITSYTGSGTPSLQTRYAYDGLGRKRATREFAWDTMSGSWQATSERRTVLDGLDVVQERDASNSVSVSYTRAGNIGGLLGKSRRVAGQSDVQLCYHYDGAGNVAQLSNSSGALVAKYAYDAWGNTRAMSGGEAAGNRYRYKTKEVQSQNGLYDFGLRFYSPNLGRFLNRDPISENGGLNLYAYAANSPTVKTDAYGLSAVSILEAFARGVWDGLVGDGLLSRIKAAAIGAGISFLMGSCAPSMPGLLAVVGALATAYGFAQLLIELNAILNSDLCPEEKAYRIGKMVGNLIAEAITGKLGHKFGPKNKGCFVAGTQVLMGDGSWKPIEEVQQGDEVLAKDEQSGQVTKKRVQEKSARYVEATLVLSFSDGQKLETTDEHPFYVEGKGFVAAGELGIGTSIVTRAGPSVAVTAIEHKNQGRVVYNFAVQDFATYFVAAPGAEQAIWVHNADCLNGDNQPDLPFDDLPNFPPKKRMHPNTEEGINRGREAEIEWRQHLQDQGIELAPKRGPNSPGPDAVRVGGADPGWDWAELKPHNSQGFADGAAQIAGRDLSGRAALYTHSGGPGSFTFNGPFMAPPKVSPQLSLDFD